MVRAWLRTTRGFKESIYMNNLIIENIVDERVSVDESIRFTNPVLIYDDIYANNYVFFGLDKNEAVKYIDGDREVVKAGKPAVIIKIDIISVQIFSWSEGVKRDAETYNAGRQQQVYFKLVNDIFEWASGVGGFTYINKEERAI